jgi:hypothetical protein
MLTLLLALTVTQAPTDFTPPPMPVSDLVYRRSASLLNARPPRVSTGALIGQMAMATGLGLVGSSLGTLAGVGAVYLGIYGGGLGIIGAVAVLLPVAVGLGILGVALGSAMFGTDFGRDFREALGVAGLTVPIAVAVALGLILLAVPPVLAIAVPFLAATICTPLIVQARKPMAEATPMKDAVPMTGATFAL